MSYTLCKKGTPLTFNNKIVYIGSIYLSKSQAGHIRFNQDYNIEQNIIEIVVVVGKTKNSDSEEKQIINSTNILHILHYLTTTTIIISLFFSSVYKYDSRCPISDIFLYMPIFDSLPVCSNILDYKSTARLKTY